MAGSGINSVYASQNSDVVKRMTPVIMMLLSDDSPILLEIGLPNSEVLNNVKYPDGIQAQFARANDGLTAMLRVADLKNGQSISIRVNGQIVSTISSNGKHKFFLPASILGGRNIIEFIPSTNADWTISNIQLFHGNGPFTRSEAVRFLTKATFGANEASIRSLLELGYEGWVDQQLSLRPTQHLPFLQQNIKERRAAGVPLGATQACSSRMDTWLHGAMNGPDQLRQRMAFALSQIFVVGDFNCDSNGYEHLSSYYDVLVNGSFSEYRELLETITINPVMGSWLSMRGSQVTSDKASPDENYAREVMQLFSIGVHELNIDGSLKLENGLPIDTYDNEIVHDTARALTGWNWDGGRFYFGVRLLPMTPWGGLWNRFHDYGEKTILNGVVIPSGFRDPLAHLKPESEWDHSGNNIKDDLKIVLDTIAAHDNVAPFISKQLIQRFVTSNPSPAYIERVARVFNNNGAGVKGDLGAVIKAILLDPESINSHENTTHGGKLKEPLLKVTQIWRAFEAKSPIKYFRYLQTKRDFGQRPLSADSVFNFYRPDYAPLGEITDQGLVAPEFNLLGDSQLLRTYPSMFQILDSKPLGSEHIISGNYTDAQIARPELNLNRAKALSDNTNALMNYLNELMFGGLMSRSLRNRVIQYIDTEIIYDPSLNQDERRHKKVEEALFLLGVSADFSLQR